ncbi:unnamed protein product [Eretmochelys imbricata]
MVSGLSPKRASFENGNKMIWHFHSLMMWETVHPSSQIALFKTYCMREDKTKPGGRDEIAISSQAFYYYCFYFLEVLYRKFPSGDVSLVFLFFISFSLDTNSTTKQATNIPEKDLVK